MFTVNLIGNLGADAEVQNYNGNKFVSFRVAVTRSYTKADGTQVDETTWASCSLHGDGGSLLQYLVRGRKVYVHGDASLRVYSSRTLRTMVAGLNVNVTSVELLNSADDNAVPRQLVTSDGALLDVSRMYLVDKSMVTDGVMMDRKGRRFDVDKKGWVTPHVDNVQSTDNGEV
jgi:single-strand DNA-binding protein